VHHCCVEKKLEHCAECDLYPCKRLGNMTDFKDLNTNNVKRRTGETIKADGFNSWYDEYTSRADMLTIALEKYNDGRMKRYLCELFIQNDVKILTEIMKTAEKLSGTAKENGKQFKMIVESILKH